MSLLTLHQCEREQIPSRTMQILVAHKDKIICLQFSHNGKYLASSSGDCEVIIWEVNEETRSVSLKHRLLGHEEPVCCISWSLNDEYLLTCGYHEVVRCWKTSSGVYLRNYGSPKVSCVWGADGNSIYTLGRLYTFGFLDKWDLQQGISIRVTTTRRMDGLRIRGNELIAILDSCKILFTEWNRSGSILEVDHPILSYEVSKNHEFLLVTLSNQEIQVWKVDGPYKVKVGTFTGHKRSRFVVKSCFGGVGDRFIASGSEDSQVYIWNRVTGLVSILGGHSAVVSCVSWNPVHHQMLASGSVDRTIRIWT